MGRQLWIADALANAGLLVVERPGWKTRGKAQFDPRGVVCHHTASNARAGDAPSLTTVVNGRPDLPGPLCHVLIARSGACHVIASGKANHAGEGHWRTLSGNSSVFGIEAENDGVGEPWSPHLVDVFERCAAALAQGCKATSSMVCGHKEWTTRKIDPAGIDMDWFRAAVDGLMRLHTPEPAPKPEPAPVEDDDMAGVIFTRDDREEFWLVSGDGFWRRPLTKVQRNELLFLKLARDGGPINVPALARIPVAADSVLVVTAK